MIKKLKINDEFKNRLDCFSCFKGLIEKDVLDLIDCYTNQLPLYKVNELIRKNYVLVKIINNDPNEMEKKYTLEQNGEFYVVHDNNYYEVIDLLSQTEGYLFLFMEENEKYKFLGLYKIIEKDMEKQIVKWQRQKVTEFDLSKITIKKLITKLDENDITLYKDPKYVIEKFDDTKIEKYISDKEKLKEILKCHGAIYKFLPEKLRNDEDLAVSAIQTTPYRRCFSIYSKEVLE